MNTRHPLVLDRDQAIILAVDLQEPFLRTINDRERVIANCRLLIQAAQALGVPVLTSLQYEKRMGGLIPEIAELFGSDHRSSCDKMTFSCAGNENFVAALEGHNRKQVLLCGVETHICVAQTALDLIARGFQVHVAPDAVSSRTLERHKLGMEKIRDAGGIPTGAEAAVFELLQTASAAEFKAIHALVK